MEKYGSTQGRSISTNKIVEFIKPLISIDLPNMAAQMRFCLESGEGFKIKKGFLYSKKNPILFINLNGRDIVTKN